MPTYTIQSCQQADQFTTQHGTFQVYSVTFREYNGPVQLNQKVNSPAPIVGSTLEGDITRDSRGNPKFKKAFAPQGAPSATGGAGSSYTPKPKNDEGMAWGNSLTNAVALTVNFSKAKDSAAAVDEALAIAQQLFHSRPGAEPAPSTTFSDGSPIPEPQGADVVPTDITDTIDLDAIPF